MTVIAPPSSPPVSTSAQYRGSPEQQQVIQTIAKILNECTITKVAPSRGYYSDTPDVVVDYNWDYISNRCRFDLNYETPTGTQGTMGIQIQRDGPQGPYKIDSVNNGKTIIAGGNYGQDREYLNSLLTRDLAQEIAEHPSLGDQMLAGGNSNTQSPTTAAHKNNFALFALHAKP